MKTLHESLKGNFTIVNLGCIADSDYLLPATFQQDLTVVEVDAAGGSHAEAKYHRRISIQKAVSGTAGKRVFRSNAFGGTSSLLNPNEELVSAYGMERYCRAISRTEVECDVLPNIMREHGLKSIDFLKTDLEGLDFEILKSCEGFLGRTLCVQCELRFEPFYETESYFHEAVSFLARFGYEVLDIIHIDRWKYKTAHRHVQIEGRAVWGDFLFFLRPDKVAETYRDTIAEAVAKQIILACMFGKKNYGEFLLERYKSSIPDSWRKELEQLLRPRFPGVKHSLYRIRTFFRPIELFLKHQIGRSQFVSIR